MRTGDWSFVSSSNRNFSNRLWLSRKAVVGFKFDTMRDMEDPVQFAKRIGVRYPLAVAADDLKQKFGGISRKKPELLDGVVLQQWHQLPVNCR